VPSSRVNVFDVVPGSVYVHFDLLPGGAGDPTADELFSTLAAQLADPTSPIHSGVYTSFVEGTLECLTCAPSSTGEGGGETGEEGSSGTDVPPHDSSPPAKKESVVPIVVPVVVVGFFAIVAVVFFVLWRRRKAKYTAKIVDSSVAATAGNQKAVGGYVTTQPN